jgi:hypothetical protein
MRMQKAYLLIFLCFWCQFDDVLPTAVCSLRSAVLTDDNDAYVSMDREKRLKRSFSCPKSWPVALDPTAHDCFFNFTRRDRPLGWKLAGSISPSPLHAFMSLQL